MDVNPDLRIKLTFDHPPTIGTSGQIRVYNAMTQQLVDTLDLSVPAGPTERSSAPKAPYAPEPYIHGPSTLTNANTKPGTSSGLATPTPDDKHWIEKYSDPAFVLGNWIKKI